MPDAVQGQCCSPSPHPETAASDHELGRIRRGLAPAREPDGVVHRGGDRGLARRAAHHAGRATALLGSGDHDGPDPQGRVPFGSAPDRRPDRLGHSPAGSRSLCSRPYQSRRAETLEMPRPRPGSDAEPVHLLVDSTGLKLCEPGEWLIEKHGTRRRRSWKTLHIGMDADTGRIVASELTPHAVDDGSQVVPLLDQVTGPLASFTGDGAYDRKDVYDAVLERHPDARVIVPPRSSAVPSAAVETAPTQRDRHLQLIAEHGRMGWQTASGYNRRAMAGAPIGRFKRVIGDGLRSRTDQRQATEMNVAVMVLNRMLELGRPESVRIA